MFIHYTFADRSDDLLALESDAREMADPLTDEEREEQQDWIFEHVMCVTLPVGKDQTQGEAK